MESSSSSRLILYFMSRPIKSYWHGSGPVHHWTGAGLPSSSAPPGTCDQWQSDSSLGVGLATHSTDPTSHVLAPHRSAVFHVSLVCLTLLVKFKVSCTCLSHSKLMTVRRIFYKWKWDIFWDTAHEIETLLRINPDIWFCIYRVHCNKHLIVICIETPSSAAATFNTERRKRRATFSSDDLLSETEYYFRMKNWQK